MNLQGWREQERGRGRRRKGKRFFGDFNHENFKESNAALEGKRKAQTKYSIR